jgi:GNAT superfamily N-acetyltransferase
METTDAGGVYRTSSEALVATANERAEVGRRSDEEIERRKERYRHFLKHDPGGAWVAADGERVVGVALALEREGVWILSLFAVDEEYRSAGVGRKLLDRALVYAEGCKGAMLASSTHPAAMRRYALAGFDLHPTLVAGGPVRRGSLPSGLKVREGTQGDLQLAAEVDRQLRGATHGPDLEFMVQTGCRLFVAERRAGRGYTESGCKLCACQRD